MSTSSFLVAVAVSSISAVWIMIHKIWLQKYKKKYHETGSRRFMGYVQEYGNKTWCRKNEFRKTLEAEVF